MTCLNFKLIETEELSRAAFTEWYRENRGTLHRNLQPVVEAKLKEKRWTKVVITHAQKQKSGQPMRQSFRIDFK